MPHVLFTTGDIFERGADLTVLPCSAKGHLSRTAERRVEVFGLPRPEELSLGSIAVHPFPGAGRETRWIAWAASVMNFTSSVEVIRNIGSELGEYANRNRVVQIIESPLLGTGVGGLDPLDAGLALKAGFEESCTTDATMFIYGQMATVMATLRLHAAANSSRTSGVRRTLVTTPIEIFFSYAHEDEALVDDVRRQLIVHERNGRIVKWHDRLIPPGSEWRSEIDTRLNRARIVLLFVSPHFIESNYCYEVEGQAALQRHQAGQAVLIPVILRPCSWRETPFGELQALPKNARPLTRWDDRDEACLDVATGVIAAVDDLIISSIQRA